MIHETAMTDEFGFKRLSVDNWMTIDPIWNGTLMSNRPGDPASGWVAELEEVNLSTSVPVELRKLFAVARAALAYSVVYYPFLALGSEQMTRVAERAVALKCSMMQAPAKLKRFADRIDWLVGTGVFDEEAQQRWHSVRHIRNEGAHPENQTILNPALALTTMEIIVELIDDLFR